MASSTFYAVAVLEQPLAGGADLAEIVLMFESRMAAQSYGAANCPDRYAIAPVRFNLPEAGGARWTGP